MSPLTSDPWPSSVWA